MTQNSLSDVLKERHARYGVFMDNAGFAQILKQVIRQAPKWNSLRFDQQEALDNIMQKAARALTGDPAYMDNWVDMAGYAQIVVDRMKEDELKNGGVA